MKMKQIIAKSFIALVGSVILLSGCSKDPVTTFTTDPIGTQTNLKTGTITNVAGPGTSGTLAIIQDGNSNQFLKLNSDFASGFSTGTVVVYLAKDITSIGTQRTAAASNVSAIGFVSKNGAQYIKMPVAFTGYSYVVFYCETAEINFGYAALN